MQEGAPDTWQGLSMTDANLYSGTNWYLTSKDGNAGNACINSHMVTLTLRESILFKEIAICIGSYQNKKIREELYIEVEDEYSNKWYPSGEFANYQSGSTGCYDEKTELLTEDGWKYFKDIVNNKQKNKSSNIKPKNKSSRISLSSELYRI